MASSSTSSIPAEDEQETLAMASSSTSSTPTEDEKIRWLKCIKEWFPDRHGKAYFLPPVIFKRKNYSQEEIAQQPLLIPQPPRKRQKKSQTEETPELYPDTQCPTSTSLPTTAYIAAPPQGDPAYLHKATASDALHDNTAEHVLRCLQVFSKQYCSGEAMMVISQLDFQNMPRPDRVKDSKGDFDVLIIHRRYGLIACEVKAVGTYLSDLEKAVRKKVELAKWELGKAKTFLTGILEAMDASESISITKTIIMPNVTSTQVTEALRGNEKHPTSFWHYLLECVDSTDVNRALRQCLCKDQMPSIEDLNILESNGFDSNQKIDILSAFSDWWKEITSNKVKMEMSEEIYDELLARFCGPAATVEVFDIAGKTIVRTLGQAVAKTGHIMSSLVLYPDQVSLVCDHNLNCVHLYGPPGTGKTVVLYVKGCQWLDQGHDVCVVSLTPESLAVSLVMCEALTEHRRVHPPSGCLPKVYHRNISEVSRSSHVKQLAETALSQKRELYVLADEVMNVTTGRPSNDPQMEDRKRFYELMNILTEQAQARDGTLSLWCASMEKMSQDKPDWLYEQQLTVPLRSPPAVTREVAKSIAMGTGTNARSGAIVPYTCINTTATAAVNELPVRWLDHSKHKGSKNSPMYCDACGTDVVKLLDEFHVGEGDLQYRDVTILCSRLPNKTHSGGIVGALREEKKPFKILKSENSLDFQDAVLGQEDKLIISDYRTMAGLTRYLVIGMGVQMEGEEMPNRLMSMSRCNGQLVWIGKPTKA